jgi:hypothetical protein
MKTTIGTWNIGVGLWVMAAFMIYGFVLFYLRDFVPGREVWIESYNTGAHFEARLAHAARYFGRGVVGPARLSRTGRRPFHFYSHCLARRGSRPNEKRI